MKRVALLCMGLAMGVASAAEAQLTMQMSNGWSFTFGGNVTAFFVYEKPSDNAAPTATPGGIVAGWLLTIGGLATANEASPEQASAAMQISCLRMINLLFCH